MEEITLSLWRQETCVRWKAEWNGGAMQAFCQLTSVLVTLLTTRLPHYEILCTHSKSYRRPPPPWFAKNTNGAIIVFSWDLHATRIVSSTSWSCTKISYLESWFAKTPTIYRASEQPVAIIVGGAPGLRPSLHSNTSSIYATNVVIMPLNQIPLHCRTVAVRRIGCTKARTLRAVFPLYCVCTVLLFHSSSCPHRTNHPGSWNDLRPRRRFWDSTRLPTSFSTTAARG